MAIEKRLDYTNPSGSLIDPQLSLGEDRFTADQLEAMEAMQGIDEQISRGQQWTAEGSALLAELGGGLYMSHKLHRSAKFAQNVIYAKKALRTLSTVKKVSAAGVLLPEGTSTIGGAFAYAAADAAIWGVSNLAGQSIRKSMGVQDEYSAGEAVAASVFGMSFISRGADRVLGIAGKSFADQKLWKSRTLIRQGTSLAISGASLGIAETAMRQEMQMLLNERENRSVSEYVLAAGLGSSLNTGFGLIASTGKWGRKFAKGTAEGAKARMQDQLVELKNQLKIASAKGQRGRIKALRTQIRTQEDAIKIADDVAEMLESAGKVVEFHETPFGQKWMREQRKQMDMPEPSADPKQSQLDGVPDAANAKKTQVATTTPTYVKAADILNDRKAGNTLDYGAGRGKGSEAIGADSYEPFPQEGFDPTYKDAESIPSESYDKVVSASVLNVVPPDVRNTIVQDIGRVLKQDGEAIITARTVSDVAKAKNKTTFEGEENAFIIGNKETGTYQKGFTQAELMLYVKSQLGDDFEVVAAPKTKDGQKINGAAVLVRKLKSSAVPEPAISRSPEQLEQAGRQFLEQEGLGLEDFIIDPITKQPSPVPVSGSGGARKPTMSEMGAHSILVANVGYSGGVLNPSFNIPIQKEVTLGAFIDSLLDPKSNLIISADEKTAAFLDTLRILKKSFPEAMSEVKVSTDSNLDTSFFQGQNLDSSIPNRIRILSGSHFSTLVHETIHSLTSNYIYRHAGASVYTPSGKIKRIAGKEYLKYLEDIVADKAKPILIRELSELYLEVIKRMGVRKQIEAQINSGGAGARVMYKGYAYGLGNLDEFLAEAMMDPLFQRELNSIEFKRKGRSAWSMFKDLIKRIMGFDVTKGSALDEVLSLTSAIAKENDELYTYVKRKRLERDGRADEAPEFKPRVFKGGVLAELEPNSAESLAISNLPKFEEKFLPKGEITSPFKKVLTYGNQRLWSGEIDGAKYSFSTATKGEAIIIAARQHVNSALDRRRSEINSFISIGRVGDELGLNIEIEPLNTLKLGYGFDSNVEITIRDADGKSLRYADLDKQMQYEVNLALKANGGVYVNPPDTPDIGTPKAVVDPENQLNFINELDAAPPLEDAVPPPPPPLDEQGAAGAGGDSRYDQLRLLRKRFAKFTDVEGEPKPEELGDRQIQTELPLIAEEIKRLDRDSKELLDNFLVEFAESGPAPETLQAIYDEIVFMRKANAIRDTIETTFGRTGLKLRKDADLFSVNARFSIRAIKEDEALAELEDILRGMITGKNGGEDDSLEELLGDFLDDFFDTDPDFAVDVVNVREELDGLQREEADADDLKITQEDEITPTEITSEGTTKKKKKNNSLTLDQKLAKREKRIKDQIKKLEDRLAKARLEFVAKRPIKDTDNTDLGLEDELIDAGQQPQPDKTPKDPRIERLQKLLRFYDSSRTELKRLIDRKRERARLAAIEGSGDITLQKKELEKPEGGKKPTSLDKVNKDIRDLRQRMRQRLKEIEAAERQLEGDASADAAARIENKLKTKKERLQKQLTAYRERFTERYPTDDVAEIKRRKVEDEETAMMEEQIKFYRNAEKEAAQTRQLSEELARLAEIEGKGIISQLDDTVGEKPKAPKLEDPKIKELRRKIAESKARMRKKLADLEQGRFDQEQIALAFKLEKMFIAQLDKDNASRFTRFVRVLRSSRTMALIAQLPSVFAGVPTGAFGMFKQVFRIPVKFLSAMAQSQGDLNPRLRTAKLLAQAEIRATFAMLPSSKKEAGEYLKALKRSYFMNMSVTDNMGNRFDTEGNKYGNVKGTHALVVQARANAERRVNARDSVSTKFGQLVINGFLNHVISFGVRGIVAVDDMFKRSLIRSRVTADSYRRALLEFPEGGPKMEKRAKELYETAWTEQDGLPVLADNNDFSDEINNIRTELLFASNADNVEDVATSIIDQVIKPINNIKNSDNIAGFFMDALMPFFGVAMRGVYRTGRIQFFPLLAVRAGLFNPYTKKIKKMEGELRIKQDILSNKNIGDDQKVGVAEDIEALINRIDTVKVRRLKYNEEMLTDIMVGASIASISMIGGALGNMTGSMGYLSNEQRKRARKLGIQPYRALGMDYRAAMPATFGVSMYADIGTFLYLRRLQAETGQPILDPDLNLFEVMRMSAIAAAKELPLAGGINTFEDLTSDDPEAAALALEKLVLSYIPNPAEARKIVKKITVDNKVVDLKGGTFVERVAYQVLGVGPMNYETDYFGEDLQTDVNWVTETIWRQAPRFKNREDLTFGGQKILTFDDIILSDSQSIIGAKPTHLSSGIKMQDFRNEEGVTLKYFYAQQLRTYRKQYRGRKLTLNEAVNVLINDSSWQDSYMKGYSPDETNPEKFTNTALVELNELMREYYTGLRQTMLRQKITLSAFINKDEQSLSQYMDLTLKNVNQGIKQKPFSLKDLFQ
jgi:SAM-dependent methyltransferase/cyanate lyase